MLGLNPSHRQLLFIVLNRRKYGKCDWECQICFEKNVTISSSGMEFSATIGVAQSKISQNQTKQFSSCRRNSSRLATAGSPGNNQD